MDASPAIDASPSMDAGKSMAWLPLRQELNLFPGPEDHQGSPTWVMQDPASQRFFRFDWPALEMLRRWHLSDPAKIATAICNDTTLTVSTDDVKELQMRLYQWELLQAGQQHLRQHWPTRAKGVTGWRWLLHHYLYIRIPLIRPQRWLDRWGPRLSFLYGKAFWITTLCAGLLGLYLASQQWSRFVSTFLAYTDWHGALYLALAMAVVKCFHELGHALTAHRYGCRVASMGIVFLVMWPLLFTDTSEAWTLRSRRQRLAVGAAGLAAEAAIAAWATLFWHFVPEGPLQTALFFLSTTALAISLALNLSPFMRFDGYFLLCDALDQPNLHDRAFRWGRWWLRTNLWGLQDEMPESQERHTRRALILFAFGVWIYRFFLFLGIAVVVYHLFFKALGIFLMMVEVGFFIVRPLSSELLLWWKQRGSMEGWRRWRTLGVMVLLILPAIVPWSTTLRLPATHGAAVEREIHVPLEGQLQQLNVHNGQSVKAGEVIAVFASPELQQSLSAVQQERDLIQWQLERQGFDSELLALGQSLPRRLEESMARELSLSAEMAKLTVTAPVDGVVVDQDSGLREGIWLAKDSPMLRIVSPDTHAVRAWVSEDMLGRLNQEELARFIPEAPELPTVKCSITRVDEAGTPVLTDLAVASSFGGALPVRKTEQQLIPEGAWYKLQLDNCPGLGLTGRVRGTLHVDGRAESLLAGALRRAWGVLLRESGWGY